MDENTSAGNEKGMRRKTCYGTKHFFCPSAKSTSSTGTSCWNCRRLHGKTLNNNREVEENNKKWLRYNTEVYKELSRSEGTGIQWQRDLLRTSDHMQYFNFRLQCSQCSCDIKFVKSWDGVHTCPVPRIKIIDFDTVNLEDIVVCHPEAAPAQSPTKAIIYTCMSVADAELHSELEERCKDYCRVENLYTKSQNTRAGSPLGSIKLNFENLANDITRNVLNDEEAKHILAMHSPEDFCVTPAYLIEFFEEFKNVWIYSEYYLNSETSSYIYRPSFFPARDLYLALKNRHHFCSLTEPLISMLPQCLDSFTRLISV